MSVSSFMSLFDTHYLPKLGIRASTFRAVLREAEARDVKTIVETGTIRKDDNWKGDGQSTVIWNAYALFHGASFETVDVDPEAVKFAATKIAKNNLAHCFDSVRFLSVQSSPIDLLYLDSQDLDMDNMHPSALHCFFEFCAARPCLRSGSIVFIDDSPIHEGGSVLGKGLYVAQYLKHLGVLPFTSGYQVGFIMP